MAQNKPPKIRRQYDSSFKTEIIQMIAIGSSVPELARSLNIGENIIYRWRQQALVPASPPQTSVSEATGVYLLEHLALHKPLHELEQERDILKKALGIFSRPL